MGWRSHAGELEDYQEGLYAEVRLGTGFGERAEVERARAIRQEILVSHDGHLVLADPTANELTPGEPEPSEVMTGEHVLHEGG